MHHIIFWAFSLTHLNEKSETIVEIIETIISNELITAIINIHSESTR